MGEVKVERIYGRPVMGREARATRAQRVRFDGHVVGVIHDRSPVAGSVTFIVSNLTDDETKHVLREVSAIMDTEATGTVAPAIPAKDESENIDYGDF